MTIPNSVTRIGSYAFSGCPIESATIPTTVISYIPKGNLKTVVINGGASIDDYAFYGCKSLTSVTIPDSVTSIGSMAFRDCESLTSVTIGDSVTSIGSYAFYNCTSLTVINCEAESQPDGWNSYWKSGYNATVVWGYKDE